MQLIIIIKYVHHKDIMIGEGARGGGVVVGITLLGFESGRAIWGRNVPQKTPKTKTQGGWKRWLMVSFGFG